MEDNWQFPRIATEEEVVSSQENSDTIQELCRLLKCQPREIESKLSKLQADVDELKRKLGES